MNCPWSWLQQIPATFCESNLCAWIREPANTWSNVGFLIVGFWLYRRARLDGLLLLTTLALASALTGLGSGFFHASGTYWGGVFDYGGMVLGTGVFTGLNLRRWRGWGNRASLLAMGIVTATLISAVVAFPGEERWIYALSGPCCAIELILFFTKRREIQYRFYLWSWAVVGGATVLWWLDQSKYLCDPQNHFFNGHAAWHLLTAFSYLLIYRFYSQFSVFED